MMTEQQIDVLNRLVSTAIDHGGAYFSYPEEMLEMVKETSEAFDIDYVYNPVKKYTDVRPMFKNA